MPIVISSLHPKGGVGKSTTALCIAECARVHEQQDVLVLDTDPQGTSARWSQSAETGPLVVHTPNVEQLEAEIERLGSAYELVVVDGSAQLKGATGAVIRLSDLVLLPVQPSPADVWATEPIVQLIHDRREAVGSPAAGFVVNRATPNTNIADDVVDVLESMDLPVLATLHQRVAFVEALVTGETPLTYKPKGKAANEQNALYDAAIELLATHYA